MELLTVQQAAEKLGISTWRVYQLIQAGRLPATLFGTNYAIRRADLEKVAVRKPGRPRKLKDDEA